MKLTDEQLTNLKAKELDIFKAFIAVCEKLNVKYYLIGGTLLGAVRHGGFIPWDDDIDVGIPRPDYERFLAEAQAYLPEHLFLQTFDTDPEYPQVYAKIRDTETAFIEIPVSHRKMNHGIFMDIFPLDFHPASISEPPKCRLLNLRISCAFRKEAFSARVRLLRFPSRLLHPTLKGALTAKDKRHRKYTSGENYANYCGIYGKREIIPAEWYGEGTPILFEGVEAIAPKEYDKVLTSIYGDYMTPPPPEKRVTLHVTDVIDTEKSYKEYIK